nr:hypothetical protein [Tanacetum cinerariifolium]
MGLCSQFLGDRLVSWSSKKQKSTAISSTELDNKKFKIGAELFHEIFSISPRVPNEEFVALPPHDALVTFLKSLGNKRALEYVANPFQILWELFYKRNVDYAELLWEDFQYQIDYRQTSVGIRESMSYPRFTKVIISHFLSKHKSIPKRHGLFMNSIKDDVVLGSLSDLPCHIYWTCCSKESKKGNKTLATPKKNVTKKPTSDESDDEHKERLIRRKPTSVVIRDTLNVSTKKTLDKPQKLKGNTRDLGSFGEETDKITDLHKIHKEVLFTERGDGVAGITRRHRDLSSDGVRDLVMALGRGRLKEDLESST